MLPSLEMLTTTRRRDGATKECARTNESMNLPLRVETATEEKD
jgi:hypothetical protein